MLIHRRKDRVQQQPRPSCTLPRPGIPRVRERRAAGRRRGGWGGAEGNRGSRRERSPRSAGAGCARSSPEAEFVLCVLAESSSSFRLTQPLVLAEKPFALIVRADFCNKRVYVHIKEGDLKAICLKTACENFTSSRSLRVLLICVRTT